MPLVSYVHMATCSNGCDCYVCVDVDAGPSSEDVASHLSFSADATCACASVHHTCSGSVQQLLLALQVRELSPAEAAKEDGNAAFKRGDLPAALAAYTLALEMDPALMVAANNRAMVNLRMQRFGDAESDCNLVRACMHMHMGHCRAGAPTCLDEPLKHEFSEKPIFLLQKPCCRWCA